MSRFENAPRFLSIVLLVATAARAAADQSQPLFTIDKSQNRNLVQYMIRVDSHCVPFNRNPVYAYWRMRELGPRKTQPLLPREQHAYGVASQRLTRTGKSGGVVQFSLRALPSRTIVVQTAQKHDGTCEAQTLAMIAGEQARLFDVYVKLNWLFGVDYLLLRGWSMDGKRLLSERLVH